MTGKLQTLWYQVQAHVHMLTLVLSHAFSSFNYVIFLVSSRLPDMYVNYSSFSHCKSYHLFKISLDSMWVFNWLHYSLGQIFKQNGMIILKFKLMWSFLQEQQSDPARSKNWIQLNHVFKMKT